MLTTRHNRHHRQLPPQGALLQVRGLERNGFDPSETWRVEAYPLNDNVAPYSYGIHTVYIRSLRRPSVVKRVSGIWCDVME